MVDVKTGLHNRASLSGCLTFIFGDISLFFFFFSGSEQTTNDFRFTWCCDEMLALPRKVVPRTYKGARSTESIIILCFELSF